MTDRESQLLSDALALEAYISATFVISKEDAHNWAKGFAIWADGHADPGAPRKPFDLGDWLDVIHKRVGGKFEWQDQQKKLTWLAEQAKGVAGYNEYLDAHRPSPFKKW